MPQAKPVAIVGGSSSFENAPFDDKSIDIWAFNVKGTHYPRLSALIQIHTKEVQEEYAGHVEWLQNTRVPVYMNEERSDIPACIVYPYDEALALTDHVNHRDKRLEYFTSSFPWAIALAILQNRPKIYFYGVEMTATKEYKEQRDCFAFWVGFAAGRGIEIEINCADKIFQKELYG